MPPAILNDSDDEDGDILLQEVDDPSTAHPSGGQEPVSNLDGSLDSNGRSTGSTERLKKQLADAERNLFTDSAEQSRSSNGNQSAQAPSTSPTLPRTKRRHTEITSNPSASADATVKRTKTLKTYPTKKLSSIAAEKQRFFEEFHEDDADLNTAQLPGFSDRSRYSRSSGLPGGTMQAAFVEHEPTVMFKDSGSTVPDNDSSHDRMVEKALQGKANGHASMVKLNDADEIQQKSSSFPWSASEQTDMTKTPASKDASEVSANTEGVHKVNDDQANVSKDEDHGEAEEIEVATMPSSKESEPAQGSFIQTQETGKRYASPMVQVDVQEAGVAESTSLLSEPSKTIQKATRGRKRKIQDDSSESLHSDDMAVGLPREQYKPRPSKRRSTQIAAEPVDYSVAPEKAAKSKRSKTTGGSQRASNALTDSTLDPASQLLKPPVKGLKSKQAAQEASKESKDDEIRCICGSGEDDGNTVACDTCDTWQHIVCYYPESGNKLPKNMRHDCVACRAKVDIEQEDDLRKASDLENKDATTARPAENLNKEMPPPKLVSAQAEPRSEQELNDSISQRPSIRASQASSQTKAEDAVFKKPVAKLKPVSKSKRSQTTIFEDHVEFMGMQSSPSLRQQQAARKSALKDVKNEALPPSKFRRAAKLPEDEEDEADELAFDPAQEEEDDDAPPKKRGRGRPPKAVPKATTKAHAKSAEIVIDGSDHEDEAEEEIATEQPKKRGRGRPSKTQSTEVKDAIANDEMDEIEAQTAKEAETEKAPELEAPSKQSTATNMPTPSPDRPAPGKDIATPQKKGKGSPTEHTPIKNKSTVPLRVGLSKRQRIPSLLQMRKPPPKKIGK